VRGMPGRREGRASAAPGGCTRVSSRVVGVLLRNASCATMSSGRSPGSDRLGGQLAGALRGLDLPLTEDDRPLGRP
jgi:hypothetical protein